MCEDTDQTRRKVVKFAGAAGVGAMLTGPINVFASDASGNIQSRGYAAFDESGKLKPWKFERRPVGDNDVLIDIKFASICHSDIHQEMGHWGKQKYPQVPGHEIVGVVAAVGKNVTKFKVGDRAGVGCMVGNHNYKHDTDEEQYNPDTIFTYGYPDDRSPTGISQGGYSNNIVLEEDFVMHVPENISFEEAAPLMCAGITTYSPLMRANLKPGTKVAIAGIGGLGHMAIKIAASKGAEVYAFTTSASKVKDILAFGAKEAIVVDDLSKLAAYHGQMDYMLCTIPYDFNVAAYAAVVKPYGTFTQVGMPIKSEVTLNALFLAFSRVNFNASLIGGIRETQEMVDYCAENKVLPKIQKITAVQINDAWESVVNKEARYRYVIDASTF
ncbi:NAD(P)-dependent alcohol dehydrogenase [Shewanella sp. Isolate11]|uniref:NAD(P)-dependent alcohol dehydrogenase n=1 Tax=Shewanella sp. Isolate11 TaxID=2908530 RepID=UPI001EFC7D68|nr:NAD(P)-dependent alcohol dehydrogenase [Shewanella sp. Isolate11]MCG9698343.1 NAD(P)-dependent alcohol dehydrogenase [Shewanella sp. Isolate11]